ncbi:stage V sporulation protein AC [Paenibacillus shirakamiensis]|uniref:Stage V sporulation protein AC n=1 Tax=Paenibacillus shirakamiensis TaxID=1265935 RepID=A0ABS4JBM1_9BACL|nr:stage V sporulation protein AC [Paenibacillus shirakamiensis]MBP1999108.1 stage V sporulation protein AC [Paenibacillus shirakamiensis]
MATKPTSSRSQVKGLSPKEYQAIAKQHEPRKNILTNCLKAFLVGGAICLIGQCIQQFFMSYFDMTTKEAGNPTVAVLIFISVVVTSLGLYDKLAQWAGAGSAVPVTGFANSMCSAAIEHKAEGMVLGLAANMFKLAGAVIVFGVVAAFLVGIVHIIFGLNGVH